VVIHYPHHPRAGESIAVLRRVLYAEHVHFVIEQADGSRVLLPEWMTEPWAATLPVVDVPGLSLDALRALCRLINANRVVSSPSSTANHRGSDAAADTMAATQFVGACTEDEPASATRSSKSRGDQHSTQTTAQRMRGTRGLQRGGSR
jgi:hypothetical protein